MQTKEDEEKKNIRQTLELYFHNNCITSIWIGDKRILRKLYTGVDKLRILPWFLDVFEAPFYPFVCIKCETIFFSLRSLLFCVFCIFMRFVFFALYLKKEREWISVHCLSLFIFLSIFSVWIVSILCYFCPDLNLCSATTPKETKATEKYTKQQEKKNTQIQQNACVVYYNLNHI